MKKLLIYLFIFPLNLLFADADISFLVADLKVSQEHGVKICEVQHGMLSAFFGTDKIAGKKGTTLKKFIHFIDEHFDSAWYQKNLVAEPEHFSKYAKGWKGYTEFPKFPKSLKEDNIDRESLASYSALMIASPLIVTDIDRFKEEYPRILVMDLATYPYWRDKGVMSALFDGAALNPEWNLYDKTYSPQLASQIINDLGGDRFVIKPRNGSRGKGIVIVDKEDLDETLKLIFQETYHLKGMRDKSYHFWLVDKQDQFIVERYYPSDPVYKNGKPFDATMRIGFILSRDKGVSRCELISSVWKLPRTSLDSHNSLNDKHKSYAIHDNFLAVPPETLEFMKEQFFPVILQVYEKMLM